MKKYKLALILTTVVVLLSISLAGCAAGGIPQEQYDSVAAQIKEAQAKVADLQDDITELKAQNESAAAELKTGFEAELKAAQVEVARLQDEIGGLKEQYELVGATPAETAENIVRYYHETHEYSTSDLFICSDMASEVWNMLKAQGINAVMVVGNKDAAISDILQCNHAWVLAEVAPGEHLALETTGGRVIPKSENPLYYKGWSFASPAELKAYNQLVREYNIRVDIRNKIAEESNEVMVEHNKSTSQSAADKLKAVYDKLQELMAQQETELNNLSAEIDSLATELR